MYVMTISVNDGAGNGNVFAQYNTYTYTTQNTQYNIDTK